MLFLDWPLWGLAAIYFILSFAMQRVINRLPLFCSLFWPFIAVWGITWTVIGYALAADHYWSDSTIWQHVWRLAFIFMAALPGQAVAYHKQTTILAKIFRDKEISKRTTGHTIFFRELFDETDYDDGGSISNVPDHIDNGYCRPSTAKRRVGSYRRWYPN